MRQRPHAAVNTFMSSALLPPAQDTQVGFMEAKVPGNRMHLSVGEWAEPGASVSGSARPGDLGPSANKQPEPPAGAQAVPRSLEESEHPELTPAQRPSGGNEIRESDRASMFVARK